jgi:hypothetical protein
MALWRGGSHMVSSGAPSLVASENSHLKLAASGYFKYFSGS